MLNLKDVRTVNLQNMYGIREQLSFDQRLVVLIFDVECATVRSTSVQESLESRKNLLPISFFLFNKIA